jgi:hypothetical protein
VNEQSPFTQHVQKILALVRTATNLPGEFNALTSIPPGTRDSAEMETLFDVLDLLGANRDGSNKPQTARAREDFSSSLKQAAESVGDAIGNLVAQVQNKLDALAKNGVKTENILLTSEFKIPPQILFAPVGSDLVPIIFARVEDLPENHPARSWVLPDQLYTHELSTKGLILGEPIGRNVGAFERYIPPYALKSVVVRATLALSKPQVQAREDYLRQEEAEKQRRLQAYEDAKRPAERVLEAKFAKLLAEFEELKKTSRDPGKKNEPNQ